MTTEEDRTFTMHPSHFKDNPDPEKYLMAGIYTCPCCSYRIDRQLNFETHISNHLKLAVKHEGYFICKCNHPCRTAAHFHCLYCSQSIIRKEQYQLHISQCTRKEQYKLNISQCSITPKRELLSPSPVSSMSGSNASSAEPKLLMEFYEEVKHIITKKGNTSTIMKEREKAWQTIADRLNATNLSGLKRTWQQVKLKCKNILQAAVKKTKTTHKRGTGRPPSQDLTPAEDLKKGPVMEGIQGGTVTDSVPATETVGFKQVSGNRRTLLDPPEDNPGEGTSAAAGCTSADEVTVSPDSRRLEDQDAAQSPKPGNINSEPERSLYTKHLEKQIELADIKITLKKRKLQEMEMDLEIKRKTLRKLDLEIKKLEETNE